MSLLPVLVGASTKELAVYSAYDAARMKPIFEPFTKQTGIEVIVISGTSGELIDRLEKEGENSPADVYLDKDLVFQGEANRKGLYRPFQSPVVEQNVSSSFIESGRNWFTLFYRARIIAYNHNRVTPTELSTYEALAGHEWKGRLCLRTSESNYNQALSASLIRHIGTAETLTVLNGWAANLALDPLKSDTDAIKAVAEGKCDVAIVNTYYLAPFLKEDANYPVRPFFPNQKTSGAHLNGVGVGLARHTKNVAEATLLLEYLSSKEVQTAVAAAFSQYPVNPKADVSPVLTQHFGPFVADQTSQQDVSNLVDQAKSLIRESNYR